MKIMQAAGSWLAMCVIAGCTTAGITSGSGPNMDSARAESYDGPKARIVIIDFEDKMSSSGHYRAEYGRGMSDMLATALFQSQRYVVLEREKLGAIEAERRRRNPSVKLEDADIMITAAITGFDPGAAGGEGGLGGAFGGRFASLLGSVKQARVAMDLRVIDVDTGRVIAATSVEGKATGVGAGLASVGGPMTGGLSGFAKGPMEGAIRDMIRTAVDFVVGQTPKTYYRYQQ